MSESKKLLTTRDVARAWAISDTRVRQLRLEGRLPGATEMGGTWVYPIELVKVGYTKKKAGRPTK